MIKNSQGQILQQKLSPQAIQAQLLLAIPALALEQEVKKQLEDNPMLEDEKDVDTEDNHKTDNLKTQEEENYSFENNYNGNSYLSGRDGEDNSDYLINKAERLKESPIEQLYNLGFDNKDAIIGEEILGNLDDDGYLRISFEIIIEDIKEKYNIAVSGDEVDKILKIVQKLEPVGIAARNLQECLTIQLEELDIDENDRQLCIKMINDCFEDFRHKHFEKLAKLLNVNLEKINELFEIIHHLNPVPGKQDTAADFVYPDFIVTKQDGKLIVELNSGSEPKVKISKKYLELLNDKSTDAETKDFLKNKYDSAKWFINAIHSRKMTMLKVMNSIVKRQDDFFETQGEKLKPMLEKDIAEDVSMDISTISRVVRGKYVQTDFGIFELKYFFSGAMRTDAGDDVSSKMIKEKIRELIEKEDKTKPLSDDKITDVMNGSGFHIARRTVAKYREGMKIPKATLRRKILL